MTKKHLVKKYINRIYIKIICIILVYIKNGKCNLLYNNIKNDEILIINFF